VIIINEYEYVKQILETKIIPKGVSNKRILLYISKYYFNENLAANEMRDIVFCKMKEFNLKPEVYQEYKYATYVKDICEKLLSKELSFEFRKIKSVNLYQSELNIINQGENDKERKLLFTLFVLAKTNGTNSGWINNELKDIFQLANITATIKERAAMVYKLYTAELLNQSHKIDNLSLKVELGSDDEQVVLVISSFKDIGNQYIANFKHGWKMCECCGKLFKIKSTIGNPQKYCKTCAKDINREKSKENISEKRKNV
jgi:hypothetical protein